MRRTGWILVLGLTFACSNEADPEDSEGRDGGSGNTSASDAETSSNSDDDSTDDDAIDDIEDDDVTSDDDVAGETDASVAEPDPSVPNTGLDGGASNTSSCEIDSDCVLSQTTPANCAEGSCLDGECHFLARDGDRDGYRSRRCQSLIVGVEVETGEDCDDADATVNPDGWDGPEGDGKPDGCNDGIDQDCNGIIDDGQLENQATCLCMPQDTEPCATTPTGQAINFPILDEDGRPVGECQLGSRECAPNGTWGPCTDAIAPVSETCDELDNDCDSLVDEEAVDRATWFCDGDSDEHLPEDAEGYLECAAPDEPACPGTWRADPGLFDDCDDLNGDNFPGNPERCDGEDQDCDGLIDEVGTVEDQLKTAYYCDEDNDGHLAPSAEEVRACVEPMGCAGTWIANPLPSSFDDCNDAAPNTFPGNTEICDGIDNDCDGLVDELGTMEHGLQTSYYCDVDGDSHLSPMAMGTVSCTAPTGCAGDWIQNPAAGLFDDCDDTAPNRYPGNAEVCDEIDNDCDGLVDEVGTEEHGLKTDYYCDADGDGHLLSAATGTLACAPPTGCAGTWLSNPLPAVFDDCDDTSANRYPGNAEICDDIDNDCDTLIDEVGTTPNALKGTFYQDTDGDGFGATASEVTACTQPGPAWIDVGGDCQDNVATNPNAAVIYPGRPEVCNGRDDDCDGQTDAADSDFVGPPNGTGATYTCQGVSGWQITGCSGSLLHCDTNIDNGCETDATTLDDCRLCGNECSFSCGAEDCVDLSFVAAGHSHTCAIDQAGRAHCWGRNDEGRLGVDTSGQPATTARLVPSLTGATLIEPGSFHTCALSGTTAYCWGSDTDGQLGNGSPGASISPVSLSMSNVTSIASGVSHSCAVDGGVVKCWGLGTDGRLGDFDTMAHDLVSPNAAFRPDLSTIDDGDKVVAGDAHSCVLTVGDTVECWGDNFYGQLGEGTNSDAGSAQDVGLSNVTVLAAGAYHTCAVAGGQLYCWGRNNTNQLGLASGASFNTPQSITGFSSVTQIAAGTNFTCVLSSGQVSCFGGNDFGQRGDESLSATATPTVVEVSQVTQITAGSGHACALNTSNEVRCWGYNGFGQLGDGQTNNSANSEPRLLEPPP